jgi:hypothetical protein
VQPRLALGQLARSQMAMWFSSSLSITLPHVLELGHLPCQSVASQHTQCHARHGGVAAARLVVAAAGQWMRCRAALGVRHKVGAVVAELASVLAMHSKLADLLRHLQTHIGGSEASLTSNEQSGLGWCRTW